MDFSLLLFLAVLISGIIILAYKLFGSKTKYDKYNPQKKDPVLLDFAKSFFPVLLIVFLLRSFVVEPFKIPSGSMIPGLHIGDFILVKKYKYGIRLPIIHKNIFPVDMPERGDVMVFRSPKNPSVNFIKRVIGLPGDVISYKDKQLTINGKKLDTKYLEPFVFESGSAKGLQTGLFSETIGDNEHQILVNPFTPDRSHERIVVPKGEYFVMGDNRDLSSDSRSWGFVPEKYVVGQAFLIWFSWKGFDNGLIGWDRIGKSIT